MNLYGDEAFLIESLSSGNREAFEYVFKKYYQRLVSFAGRYIQNEDIVEDIVQDCYAVLWEKCSTVASISISVSAFLFAMVRNSCLNYLRHEQVIQKYEVEYLAYSQGEERLYHADFGLEIEHKLLYEELQEKIAQVVESLPERCREVFIMSRFEGLKNREIAQKLNISTTAVEKHISKAMLRFSERFRDEYSFDIYIIVIAWLIGPMF